MKKIVFILLTAFLMSQANAGSIIATLIASDINIGKFECSLWSNENGFPDTRSSALLIVTGVLRSGEMICEFTNISKGAYAISSSQDLNGNGVLDKYWTGIPKEPWGVSNSIRPTFRAPTFEEAKIDFNGELLNISFEVIR